MPFQFADDASPLGSPPPQPPASQPSTPQPPVSAEDAALFDFLTEDAPATPNAPPVAPPTPRAVTPPGAPRAVTPPNAPANPVTRPGAAPTNQAIPRPAPASPAMPVVSAEDSSVDGSAPIDGFSYRLWSMGQTIRSGLDALEAPAAWVLRVAFVLGLTALAYLVAGTFLGKAGNLTGNPNALALVKNLTLASQGFMVALLAGGVAAIVLAPDDRRVGFFVGGLGVVCYFALPLALHRLVGDSRATAAIAQNFQKYGYYLLLLGVAKGLGDTVSWAWTLPDRMKRLHASVGVSNRAEAKQRAIARDANMTSPCWKLPFCRESIRKQCPAFLAKKTCWKFGRGCYCDEEMISRIVRGESLDVIKAPTRQSRQGKAPCGRCYIYLEHQTYKFRVLSPLALPAAVLTTYLAWPIYEKVFTFSNRFLNSVWSSLSFNSTRLTPDAVKASSSAVQQMQQIGNSPEQIAAIAQNMLGVLLGFMLLIYISKAIEWAIFKAKL